MTLLDLTLIVIDLVDEVIPVLTILTFYLFSEGMSLRLLLNYKRYFIMKIFGLFKEFKKLRIINDMSNYSLIVFIVMFTICE